MIKTISLYSRKSGTSAEEFRDYYERVHLPLIVEKVPHFAEHRRNFVISGDAVARDDIGRNAGRPAFDVVTTIKFEDGAAQDRMRAALSDPAVGPVLLGDTAKFIDVGKTIRFEAEEYHTPAADLGDSAARDLATVKMMILIKRRPGLSREDFIAHYEQSHAPLSARLLRATAGYTRSYPVPGTGAPDHIDVVTEMWFRDQAKFDELAAMAARPKVRRLIADDEAKVFDRPTIQMFMVDEHVTKTE